MDAEIFDLVDIIMVVYQDGLIAFSKKSKDHCMHLGKTFTRDLEYEISLKPENVCLWGKKRKIVGPYCVKGWNKD